MAQTQLTQEGTPGRVRIDDTKEDPSAALWTSSPNSADLEAAVELVYSGMASRVVLTGLRSWPGLLWHIYQISTETGLLIVPTAARGDGRVDIVVTHEIDDE